MLVALTAWRYLLRRDPPRADGLDWSTVFPLGMYSVATLHLAHALDLGFLQPMAAAFFWLAAVAWTATLGARATLLHAASRRAAA